MTDNKDTMNHLKYESGYNEKKLPIKSQNMISVIKSYQLQITATGSERKDFESDLKLKTIFL